MKLIYTRQNRLVVNNVQNLLEQAGIETALRNEFSSGAAGELSPLDTWLELWVVNDDDYPRAAALVASLAREDEAEWVCARCGEHNASSFEFCWNCQAERPGTGDYDSA